MAATHGRADAEAGAAAQGAGGRILLMALNASSRHGPHSAVPAVPIAASAVPTDGNVQAQNPGSSLSVPAKGVQREPLAIGGRTRINWSKARIRTRQLGALMDH